MRANPETPLLIKNILPMLTQAVNQKPNCKLCVREGLYGFIVDTITYDPDDDAIVISIVENY